MQQIFYYPSLILVIALGLIHADAYAQTNESSNNLGRSTTPENQVSFVKFKAFPQLSQAISRAFNSVPPNLPIPDKDVPIPPPPPTPPPDDGDEDDCEDLDLDECPELEECSDHEECPEFEGKP